MAHPLVLVLSVICVFQSIQARYEWNNFYYNQDIFDQLDDYFHPWLYDKESGDRVRKLPRFRSPVCCGRYDEEILQKEDQIRQKCHNVAFGRWTANDYEEGWNQFNCDATAEVKERLKCVHQCLWRQRGALDDKYNRRDNEIRAYYHRTNARETWRDDIYDRAVTLCLGVYDPAKNPPPRRGQCNGAHLHFSYCVWREVHRNCPDGQWNGRSQYCRRVRQYVQGPRG